MSDQAYASQPVETAVEVAKMDPVAQEKVMSIARTINLEDSNAVVQYGVGAQTKISSFSDTILSEIRNKDAGYIGDTLGGLITKIREVDVDSISEDKGLFSKMFGGLKARINKFLVRYEKLGSQIDKIVQELEAARMRLLKDIVMLDNLYKKNQEYLAELDLYIAAGQLKLEEVRASIIPQMQAKAEQSGDPADAQAFQDMSQLLNRFEKKIHDMKLSRMIGLQMGPQIRLVQTNNQTLVEKIQSSVLNTIPLWKNQMVIAISLFRQRSALEMQRRVSDTTNQLLAKNSEMLKQGSIEVAKESERGIVEVETLQKVNADLIATIEETLKIQEDGRTKRAQAEHELAKMEKDLHARLASTSAQ